MKDRYHSFSVEEAKKYGIEKAILLSNIRFWLDKNKANEKNIHEYTDGKEYYWTYNSAKAWEKLFPYMSAKSIGRWLLELEKSGEIISGVFNENKYDKTKWYSTFSYSIAQNEQSTDQNEQPIPVSNTVSIKKESFSENSEIRELEESGGLTRGSTYVPDGDSPARRLSEKRQLEKKLGFRETSEKIKFMYSAGNAFLENYEAKFGVKWEGKGIFKLDPVSKTLSDWHDRGMDEGAARKLVFQYFKSKKANEGVITPTACFSEHTWQAFRQNKLK